VVVDSKERAGRSTRAGYWREISVGILLIAELMKAIWTTPPFADTFYLSYTQPSMSTFLAVEENLVPIDVMITPSI